MSTESIHALETAFSSRRIDRYLCESRGDGAAALRLYTWNAAVSAAFYGPLHGLEVTLRNAMYRCLAERYGTQWYEDPATGLDQSALTKIDEARWRAGRRGKEPDANRIVAELTFGFWVWLTSRGGKLSSGQNADYEKTLWRPALRHAFPHASSLNRRQAYHALHGLLVLRNRIAHHEPIFLRNLGEDYECLLKAVGWMSSEVRCWIDDHSGMPELLATPPHAGIRF